MKTTKFSFKPVTRYGSFDRSRFQRVVDVFGEPGMTKNWFYRRYCVEEEQYTKTHKFRHHEERYYFKNSSDATMFALMEKT